MSEKDDGGPMEVQFIEVNGERCAKVRIPVAINARGEWIADGTWVRRRKLAIEAVEDSARDVALGQAAVHFVYACVPVPCPRVIAGEVERADLTARSHQEDKQ